MRDGGRKSKKAEKLGCTSVRYFHNDGFVVEKFQNDTIDERWCGLGGGVPVICGVCRDDPDEILRTKRTALMKALEWLHERENEVLECMSGLEKEQ